MLTPIAPSQFIYIVQNHRFASEAFTICITFDSFYPYRVSSLIQIRKKQDTLGGVAAEGSLFQNGQIFNRCGIYTVDRSSIIIWETE